MPPRRVSSPRRVDSAALSSDESPVPSIVEPIAQAPVDAEKLEPLLAVLDLDGTIVHAHQDCRRPYDFQIGDSSNRLYVHSRPGTSAFLQWLRQKNIQVAIYTAGTAEYASGVVKNLDPRGNLVQRSLSRDDCVPHPTRPNAFTKDLAKLRDDLKRIVLVDNSSTSFNLQPDNGILVEDWLGQVHNDMELVRVRGILEKIVHASDVREVLRKELGRQDKDSPSGVKFQPCAGCGATMAQAGDAGVCGNPQGRWFCARCWSAWGWPRPMPGSFGSLGNWWANQNFWTSHPQTPYMEAWRRAYHMNPHWSTAGNLPLASSSAGEWKNCGAPWNWQAEYNPSGSVIPASISDLQSRSQLPVTSAPWPCLSQAAAQRGEEGEISNVDDFEQFTAARAGA